jgi:hypothetical protein
MDSQSFEGMWEEISMRHGKDLQGHRVQVRVVDRAAPANRGSIQKSWNSFERKVGKLSRGRRIPSCRLYTSEDFYETSA